MDDLPASGARSYTSRIAAALDERLPNSELDMMDAGHFDRQAAADEHADLVTS